LHQQSVVPVDVIPLKNDTISTLGKQEIFRLDPQLAESAVSQKERLLFILKSQPIPAK
jgi:hypothetical protein